MTVEQWLADLEDKAEAALDGDSQLGEVIDFKTAANPLVIKRLVAMVRVSAFNAARSKGLFNDPAYWLDTAYQQTEPKGEA